MASTVQASHPEKNSMYCMKVRERKMAMTLVDSRLDLGGGRGRFSTAREVCQHRSPLVSLQIDVVVAGDLKEATQACADVAAAKSDTLARPSLLWPSSLKRIR